MRYIALLRGINVGGHRVTMLRLRQIFEELGFDNVSSYINSGNLFFNSASDNTNELQPTIQKSLKEILGYEVPTFLRTIDELELVVQESPFKNMEPTTDQRFCVVFTHNPLQITGPFPYYSSKKDMEIIVSNTHAVYVIWQIINGRPPSGTFSEEILPPQNTTRFFHTLIKILDAAKKY